MRWVAHIACVGKREVHTRLWWRKLEGAKHLEDLVVNGRVILIQVIKKLDGEAWARLILIKCRDR